MLLTLLSTLWWYGRVAPAWTTGWTLPAATTPHPTDRLPAPGGPPPPSPTTPRSTTASPGGPYDPRAAHADSLREPSGHLTSPTFNTGSHL